jgi:hypothetical protein
MDHLDDAATVSPELDFGKLLGFRNLVPVTRLEDNIRDSSGLAFTKKGDPEDRPDQ